MNEFSTYEYVVARTNKGTQKLKPVFFVLGYVVFAIGAIIFAVATKIAATLVSLAPFALVLVIFLTWRYTKVEYEISVTSGVVTFCEIYGGRSRKKMLEFRLKECDMIAPLSEPAKREYADRYGAQSTYVALSGKDTPNGYFAAFEDEKGKRCIFFFEANEKMLKICRFYNPSATTIIKL